MPDAHLPCTANKKPGFSSLAQMGPVDLSERWMRSAIEPVVFPPAF